MTTKKGQPKPVVLEGKKKKAPSEKVPQEGDREKFDRLLDDAIFGIKPKPAD